MKPEDFKAKTAEILSNLSDQAKVSTILAELTEDYDKEAVEKATVKSTAEKLTVDNEKLRQANMSLFLKVGEQKPTDTTKPPNEDKTAKYEDLFDKDGNLK
jgi:phage gp46-like protein